ncbi:GntR family transcriptional regulator [Virgibacillus sp. AGTR]|nr:GntR family transcriptional regulator [Virgibacillus sp. Bac332]MCC2249408.1 GntR family transcriptional regulator [Virgibacillus sp. AGTR]QRZ20057.1 GntR family transcriptional regulator [Virgibacillus sp. AGTR]
MTVDKEARIIDDLMEKMIKKAMEPGEKLPSENQLATAYRVPRITARKALMVLEERGYIYSVHGKGRFLKEAPIPIQLHLTGKVSFTDKMRQAGYNLTTKNAFCKKIDYEEKIFKILKATNRDTVYQIGRLRLIDDEPIAIHQSFVNELKFPQIAEDGPKIKSMFSYYRELGYTQFTSNQTLLSITFPTFSEQQLLSCSSMVPLIIVESDCLDVETGDVLEYTKILYRSDKFKYDITMQ